MATLYRVLYGLAFAVGSMHTSIPFRAFGLGFTPRPDVSQILELLTRYSEQLFAICPYECEIRVIGVCTSKLLYGTPRVDS